jgi:hypothetical protein
MRGEDRTIGALFSYVDIEARNKVRVAFVFGIAAYDLVLLPKLLASAGEVCPAA